MIRCANIPLVTTWIGRSALLALSFVMLVSCEKDIRPQTKPITGVHDFIYITEFTNEVAVFSSFGNLYSYGVINEESDLGYEATDIGGVQIQCGNNYFFVSRERLILRFLGEAYLVNIHMRE